MSEYLDKEGLTYALSKMKSAMNDTIDSKNTVVAYENFYIPETTTIPYPFAVDHVYCSHEALIPLGIVEISSDNAISNVDLQLHVNFKYDYSRDFNVATSSSCENGLRITYVKRNNYKYISMRTGNQPFTSNVSSNITGIVYIKPIDSNKYSVYAQIELGSLDTHCAKNDVNKGTMTGSVYVYWYLKKVNIELDTAGIKIYKPTDNIVARKDKAASDPYNLAVSALKSSSDVVSFDLITH